MAASGRAAWAWYKSCLSKRPMLTKATTSSIIMSCSDALCQEFEISIAKDIVREKGPNVNLQDGCPTNVTFVNTDNNQKLLSHEWLRTTHVAITGFTMSGPISHAWYALLERFVTIRNFHLGVAARMVLDALVFSPIAVASYFSLRTALEGKGLEGIKTKLKAKWHGAVMASWQFWPLANIINFGLVPVQFRVLYNNVLSLFWNSYLSHLNGKRLDQVADDRIHRPDLFEPKPDDHISPAQQKAQNAVCVCAHCRPIRA